MHDEIRKEDAKFILSPKQNKIYRELLRIDKKAAEAYEGALRV